MPELMSQLKQVVRRLVRKPGFTVVTLITLAAGIGGNTVVFSVVEGILLKPLAYPHAEELVSIMHSAPGINIPVLPSSPSSNIIYREQNRTFQDVALFARDSVSVIGVSEPEQVQALDVTDGLLPILGVPPALGRFFSRQDDTAGAPDTVILMHGYWQRKFGGDPTVIGRSVMVDGKSREIIGVMPKQFHSIDTEDPALLIPFQFDRAKLKLGNFSYSGIGRLKPGITMEQAKGDLARLIPVVEQSFPAPEGFSLKMFEDAHLAPNLSSLKTYVVGDVGKTLWILMGSIGLVLLIACANVANLLLVRVEGRSQELAVRSALGAGRGRLAAELLYESLLLGLAGGLLGLTLAYLALRGLVAIAPAGLPRIHEIGIDLNVVLFTLGASLLASILVACVPIFKYTGTKLNIALRAGSRTLSQTREQHRASNVLVVAQVALALVLLICSGLMIRTFRALTRVDPGFRGASELQLFSIAIPEAQIKEDDKVVRMEEQIARRLEAVPGASSVSFGSAIPMDGNQSYDPIFAQDHTYREGQLPPLRRFKFVAPGFLSTLQIPRLLGRDFTWDDIFNTMPVAMVSENLARELWQNPADAIGKRIRVGSTDEWREIVAVVGNVHDDGVNQDAPLTVYWPILQKNFEGQQLATRRAITYAVRSPRAGSESLMKDIRNAVWSVNANLPLADPQTLAVLQTRSMARTSFTLVMLAVAGSMALLLGAVGIYSVIAYSVSQRTREIGIRMALGAQQGTVTSLFLRQGLLLTGIGVALGLVSAFGVMRLMSSLLFNVTSADPLTYSMVSAGLVAIASLACYLPSRRAANVDPVEALRAE
ncbi:MAG: ABC transporter permease [Acidobacteriia bacterium]|nr:ABC transporter permease [Terriglobia bacterium]